MIFGQAVPQYERLPYSGPGRPTFTRLPTTGYKSNFNPFWRVMPPMMARLPRLPAMPAAMGPQPLQSMPSAAVPGSDGMVTTDQPSAPMPALPAAAARAMGMRGRGVNPYKVMRVGTWPGIHSSGRDMRYGVATAAQLVRNLSPGQFPNVNVPAGRYGF